MIAAQRETAGASGGGGNPTAPGAAEWLSLAAAPTFAIMALLTGIGGPHEMMGSAAHGASPLNGMAWMYILMSAFHSAPWLKLVSGRRSGARRTGRRQFPTSGCSPQSRLARPEEGSRPDSRSCDSEKVVAVHG